MSSSANPNAGIAIVGMDGLFPKARTLDEFWRNLCEGVDGISFFSDEELAAAGVAAPRDRSNYVKARGVLEDADLFDAAFFGMNPKEAELTDPQHRLFLECAWRALENAGCDPHRPGGAIGVFAGLSTNTYLAHNLATDPQILIGIGADFQTMVGNEKDYLPTRVSYKLNLHGPSLNIQTACSTSLVAVCVACQHLLTYQCDVALAGAVSVSFPQKRGYVYQEGGIESPDGHCRPFDAKSAGTVAGEGIGVVALKRLEDALADGDAIYAVIKGFGMNNDGGTKIGYTAPSVQGQSDVIAMAQAMAGFEPQTIGYVEAHGTGTPLGDPIEIEGLSRAFRLGTDAKNFCALGSVKSNIGHLDTAAGIAGLIKTALALHHKKIPPSLHFESPNRKINFADSPFYMNAALSEWDGSSGPRRAGVSSFGIGGTNAHVVLEEAPVIEPPTGSRAAQLFLLSAKTKPALDAMTKNLAAHLRNHPQLHPGDVACTLQTGRREFNHRAMLVCRATADAAGALASADAKRILTGSPRRENPPVVFMFPGQGAQRVNMGRQLYETEPAFRETVDRCCGMLEPHLGFDLSTVLYPKPEDVETATARLIQTAITQPAMFVVEYALARLWMSWGVLPEAMIGHSIGEYVAACLAGVFSLEDALRLVAVRGRMMQELPGGTMLAVRLPEAEVTSLLNDNLSLAVVNGAAACVVSGPGAAVETLQHQLAERGVACAPLHTSHAFHSAMMDSILPAFTALVESIERHAPQIPFISNVTGTWLTDEEATDPGYWATHLRRTVRFADGLSELFQGERVFLEVGPGQTLTGLARQHPGRGASVPVITSLPQAREGSSELETLLGALGQLWLNGVSPDWKHFYAQEQRRRVWLPTYPFERKRHWVERRRAKVESNGSPAAETGTRGAGVPPASACVVPAAGGTPALHPSRESETGLRLRTLMASLSGLDAGALDGAVPFMQMGFDSLFLTQLSVAMERDFGVRVAFRQLLEEYPTLDSLAAHIDSASESHEQTASDSFSTSERKAAEAASTSAPPHDTGLKPGANEIARGDAMSVPLTESQWEIWFASQLSEAASCVYNQCQLLHLRGALQPAALRVALQQLVDRHEALRTTFPPGGKDQRIQRQLTVDVPLADWSHLPAAECAQNLDAAQREEAQQPFDLVAGPVIRARLIRMNERHHVFMVTVHHLVCDGYSFGVLLRDLGELYTAEGQGVPGTLPPALQFSEYARTQAQREQSPAHAEDEKYWVEQFAADTPVLELPTDHPRARVWKFDGARECRTLPQKLGADLKQLSAQQGGTLFTTLFAAYTLLLRQWSGQKKFAVGVPLADRALAGAETLVGHCVNFLPLRGSIEDSRSFAEHRAVMQKVFLDADEHGRYAFGSLVQKLNLSREPGRMPLVSATFNLERMGGELQFADVETELAVNAHSAISFDLNFDVTDAPDGLHFDCRYNSSLFAAGTIQGWLGYFQTLLEGIVAAPQRPVVELLLPIPSACAQNIARARTTGGKVDRPALPDVGEPGAALQTPRVSPGRPIQETIAGIWRGVLGRKHIGQHDNFFDLGGSSLLLLEAHARVCAALGVKPSVIRFFEHPSVSALAEFLSRDMAQLIREHSEPLRNPGLEVIQPQGTLPPLILVHGAGGGMLWGYTTLSHHLGLNQPVYAFKSHDAEQAEGFASIEEMAAGYVAELRVFQSQGPYYLGGYCFGGNVAYEMARQLRAQGQKVALLALINCMPPNSGYDRIHFSPAFGAKFLRNLWYWSHYVLHLKSGQRWEFLRWKLRAFKKKLSRTVPSGTAALNFNIEDFVELAAQPEEQRSLWKAHIHALFRHKPGNYAGPVTLFRTRGHTLLCSFDEAFGWGEFAGQVSVRIVPGSHGSVMDEPHVVALASELKRCLDDAQDQETKAPGAAADPISYWKKQLADAPPLMDLPADHPRPPVPTNRSVRENFAIDESLASKLKALSQNEGGTLFITLLSAFQTLVSRYTGRDDIMIGSSTMANREAAGMAKRDGHLPGNLLVLRTDLAADPTFRQLLALTQDTVRRAQEQEISFATLVEELQPARASSYHPMFQVGFNFQKTPASGSANSQLDLELNVTETSSGMNGWFEYSSDLFEPATIQKMRAHWFVLLEGAVANPDCRLSELPLLTTGERRQLLVEWNDTALAYPPVASLVGLFEAQVKRTPDASALVCAGTSLTYRELNARANQLAHHLRTLGVGPEVLVGLCLERSERMLIGILGILKAGGAYVPLDPAYPRDRLAFMLDDANAPVLVTEQRLLPLFPRADEVSTRRAVRLDADWHDIESRSRENPRAEATAENLAYVIYTSGSTGLPKGVAIEHRAPVALMHWAKEVFSTAELSGVLAATSICFDLSVFEMFVPLSWGGTVILVENAMALATLPAASEVTLVNTVPSAMRELLRVKGVPASVQVVNLAGEPLATSLVDQIYSETSVAKVFDLYGPSETTTYSTGALRKPGVAATIGRPLANEQAYLLDRRRQPVPVGVPGELYIGGSGLARGYLNRPELTAEKFVPSPFSNGGPPERLYRTGDLARYRPDGNIEFLGRMDHQVKIRGFRIELGEIETALRRHPKLLEIVVLAREDQPGDKRLAAYFVLKPDQSATVNELRTYLKETLPEYMVPSAFVSLATLPLTANGKVDRKRLPAPDQARPEPNGDYAAPRTPAETAVAGIWCEVLGIKQVGIQDNFFGLGGNSLLAIQVVSRLRGTFRIEVPLTGLFEVSTVAGLAEGLTTARWGAATSSAPPLSPALRLGNPPLSFSQQSLWFIDQLEPGSFAYNVPAAVVLDGSLDVNVLQACLNAICHRHEILRTTFTAVEGEPVQEISPDSTLALSLVDLRAFASAESESQTQRLIAAETERPFDLSRGPLIRCTLLRLEERKQVLVVVMHHTVSDGWSLAVFFRELAAFYAAKITGKTADLPELPIQYADYAIWQRSWLQGEVLEKHLGYWREKLAGAPASLNLPAEHSVSVASAPRGAHQLAALSRPLIESLQGLNRRQGTTSFMTLLAALAIVLRKWTRQSDLVVGTVAAGRTRREVENLIGCFMNFLPLRLKFSGSETGLDVLSLVKASVLESHAHLDCPFEKVVEAINPQRHQHRNPIYNVGFLLQNFPRIILATPQLTGSFLPVEPDVALLDLRFVAEENDQGIAMKCEYRTDMFDAQTIEQLLASFCGTLEVLVQRPETKLADFALTVGLERQAEAARAQSKKDMVAVSATFTAEPLEEPLGFWMKELDLPVEIQFAPYNQVFQQLLDTASVLARNCCGLNVILIRMEDWLRAEGDAVPESDFKTKIEQNLLEFIQALKSGAARGATPCLVCFCPSAKSISAAPEHADFFRQMEQNAVGELAEVNGVQVITTEELFALYPVTEHYDPLGDELGHIPYTPAFFAALATLIARRFHALKRPAYKVIALDCDQTLWAGVCGEDGPNGIQLDPPRRALQECMRAQLGAGRLLCLCSKNNDEDVRAVFEQRTEMPLQREHFVASRINWRPKSENLKSLAEELKLGLDSFIFVDDNPVECAEVEANCPEVLTLLLPTTVEAIPQFLKHCWALDYSKATAEDKQRTALYQQNQQREQLRTQSPGLADFVAGLDLKVHITALAPDDLPRVAQLTLRTNQFNTTTRRRTEAEIQKLQNEEGGTVLTASVSDRFGDYGLVGAVIYKVEADTLAVNTFLLSCRVLGRGVEHQILSRLGRIAEDRGATFVDVHFVPSAKNQPAFDFLQTIGAPFRQALNGGYVFRFPTEFASALKFKPQNQESVEAPLRVVMPSVVTTNGAHRFSRYQWIAREADDAEKIVQMIESRAVVRVGAQSVGTGPRSDLERQLCGIWEKLLRVERVGIHDNFFELGGHSLLAVRMFAQVEKLVGKKLPVVTVFQSPTVDQLAKAIGAMPSEAEHPNLVPIQPHGSKPPLFLVHGAGGDVLWGYANLAHHTDPEQPIYGIQACGDEEFATLEDMAAYYVKKVRAFQTSGPYHLGGYCFGGNVAQEMARQLEAQGETTALLALLDCAPSSRGYEKIQWRPRLAIDFTRNLGIWFENFYQLKPAERRSLIVRKLRTLPRKGWEWLRGRHSPEGFDLEEFIDTTHVSERETRLWKNHLRLLVRHTTGPYAGPITLFRTRGHPLVCSFENDFGWEKLAPHVAVRKIPGSHEGIFMEPHVRFAAGELNKALRAVDADKNAVPVSL